MTAILTPARRQMLKERMATVPYPNLLGMKLVRLAPGEARISLRAAVRLRQYQGLIHGGAIASLADTAATFAALTAVPDGIDVVTIEFKLNFLVPFKSGRALAAGQIVRLGQRICTADVRIIAAHKIAAVGLFTMMCFSCKDA